MHDTLNSLPAVACRVVFITVSTGVPVTLVVVWARYSEQNFSFSVLFKVLTLPKGRKKCVQPLKHTSSGINFYPLKYAHAHKHTTVQWLQAPGEVSFEKQTPETLSSMETLFPGSVQEHPSACVKSCSGWWGRCECWNDIFQRYLHISRSFHSIP